MAFAICYYYVDYWFGGFLNVILSLLEEAR